MATYHPFAAACDGPLRALLPWKSDDRCDRAGRRTQQFVQGVEGDPGSSHITRSCGISDGGSEGLDDGVAGAGGIGCRRQPYVPGPVGIGRPRVLRPDGI